VNASTRLLWLLFAVNLFNYIDRQILFSVFPAVKIDLALTDTQLGLLASAFMWVYLSVAPVFGVLADRRSRPRLMGLGVGIWSAATALSGMVRSYGQLLFGRALVGVGEASYGSVAPAMLSDAFEPEHRGRALAVFSMAIPVGSALGYLLGGLFERAFGWRAAFVLVALLGVACAVAARRTLPQVAHAGRDGRHAAWPDFLRTLTFPNHLRAFLFTFLMMLSGFTVIPYVSLYVTLNIGLPERDLPLVYLAGGVATFFTARWIGRWADRAGKRRVYRRIAWISIAPLIAITHAPGLPLLAVLALTTLFFVFVPGRMVPAMAVVTSAARPGARGAFMTLNSAVMQVGSGVAATITGAIVERDASGALTHYNWVGYAAVAATVVAIFWVGAIRSLDTIPAKPVTGEA